LKVSTPNIVNIRSMDCLHHHKTEERENREGVYTQNIVNIRSIDCQHCHREDERENMECIYTIKGPYKLCNIETVFCKGHQREVDVREF
jgi:hypothetical protein